MKLYVEKKVQIIGGGSKCVIIPKIMLNYLNIDAGTQVLVGIEDDKIIIQKKEIDI